MSPEVNTSYKPVVEEGPCPQCVTTSCVRDPSKAPVGGSNVRLWGDGTSTRGSALRAWTEIKRKVKQSEMDGARSQTENE